MAGTRKIDSFAELERNQAQLRANIEASKQLVAQTRALLAKARDERPEAPASPPNPA